MKELRTIRDNRKRIIEIWNKIVNTDANNTEEWKSGIKYDVLNDYYMFLHDLDEINISARLFEPFRKYIGTILDYINEDKYSGLSEDAINELRNGLYYNIKSFINSEHLLIPALKEEERRHYSNC
jgi:hypothetical protein